MDQPIQPDHSTRTGTISGTLLVVIIQINTGELFKTALLAATGAIVSFCVTVLLKWIIKRFRRNGS